MITGARADVILEWQTCGSHLQHEIAQGSLLTWIYW